MYLLYRNQEKITDDGLSKLSRIMNNEMKISSLILDLSKLNKDFDNQCNKVS